MGWGQSKLRINTLDDVFELKKCPPGSLAPRLELVDFNGFLDFVYVTLLGRLPDPDGRKHYQALHASGLARSSIVRRLLRSKEHRASLPEASGSHEDFVRKAYQDVLGRWPDSEGHFTYCKMAVRWRGRRRVLMSLLKSGEALRKNDNRYGRILALRKYASRHRLERMPYFGRFLSIRHRGALRLDRIEIMNDAMVRQIKILRRKVTDLESGMSHPSGFGADTVDVTLPDRLFRDAFERQSRRNALSGDIEAKGWV